MVSAAVVDELLAYGTLLISLVVLVVGGGEKNVKEVESVVKLVDE